MSPGDTLGTPQKSKSQALAYTGTSSTSATLTDCDTVCIQSTTDCFVELALVPVAVVNSDHFIGAYQPTYLRCQSGFKIAAIQLSAAGTLYITPF